MNKNNKLDKWVLVESLKEDPNNPRKVFNEEHIKGLATSILLEGLINPIEVSDDMMIITGHCRYRACQLLGWTEIPIRINSNQLSEYERLRHQMGENVHQSGEGTPMNPIDTAKGYVRLLSLKMGKDYSPGELSRSETYGHVKELVEEIGVAENTVWEYLKLLEQPEFVLKDVESGRPRTYYREADSAPLEARKQLKKKIARGDYESREEVVDDVRLLRKLPDLGQVALDRKRTKESQETNRILNGVSRLALALEALPLKDVNITEEGIVKTQLEWLQARIEDWLRS